MQTIALNKNVIASSVLSIKKFVEEISDLHEQLGVQNLI